MHHPLSVNSAVHWVGALDFDIRVFDVIMRTENGTTYNSYLVRGADKTVLIETVKEAFFEEFLERLTRIADPSGIDYVVLNHAEPDHSGSLARLLSLAPKAVVLGTSPALAFAKKIVNADFPAKAVKDGEILDIGGMTLRFIHAPFLHWPDTMFTYVPEIRTLFTCDAFGCHYCDERVFNDLIEGDFHGAYKYYFDNIIGPFKPHVLAALEKTDGLSVQTICNSHGPVIRENPRKYIEMYREWAAPVKNAVARAVIAYVSAYGYTKKLAEKIQDGVESAGAEARLFDIAASGKSEALEEIGRADGLLLGSPTIAGEALPPVWDILSGLNPILHKGKKAGVFGSYGWSGEAVPNLEGRLRQLKLDMPLPGLKVRFNPSEKELGEAYEFGREFARRLMLDSD